MILSRSSLTVRLVLLFSFALVCAGTAFFSWRTCPSFCGSSEPVRTHPRVTVATPKPALLVERPSGESIALEEIAPGKRVAVIVMKGTWCPVCRQQLVRLQKRIEEIDASGAAVVGMTTEAPAENAAAAAELGLSFPILSDADGDAILSFGLDGAPHPVPGVVFLDEHGNFEDAVRGRYPGKPQECWIIERLSAGGR